MACCGSSQVRNDKYSSFSDACYTANVPKMKEQLKKQKDPAKAINERGDDGMMPIHRAAQRGCEQVIRFLLENKADVTAVTKVGESPLHIACFHRKMAAVELLLELPAVRKMINHQDNQHGMTALHVAIYRGSPEIVKLLFDSGANPDVRDKNGHNALEMAEFWTAQADAGLVSPTAKHHETRDLLVQIMKVGPEPRLKKSATKYATGKTMLAAKDVRSMKNIKTLKSLKTTRDMQRQQSQGQS